MKNHYRRAAATSPVFFFILLHMEHLVYKKTEMGNILILVTVILMKKN